MVIPNVKEQILMDLARMTPAMQRQAADLVHSMVPAVEQQGTPGRTLLRFAGAIDPVSAEEMSASIAESCERIDRDEW